MEFGKASEFRNIKLEDHSFAEQINAFYHAKLIIGQHGAGLSNAVWMQPTSTLVEILHGRKFMHYKMISNAIGAQYFPHFVTDACPEIDTTKFNTWLRNKIAIN